MSKKSSNVPPPDPRLVQAQLRSMGIQDQAIQQVMQIATQQQATNERLMPLQEQQLQLGIDASRRAQTESAADREWLLGRRSALSGTQDRMLADANAYDSTAMGNQRAAAAQAEVTGAFGDVQAGMARNLASMGVKPDAGRAMGLNSRMGVDQARMLAGAANNARAGARQEGYALTDRAANALAGYPAMSMGATQAGAAYGSQGLNLANAGAGGINAGYGAMTGAQQAASGMAGQMGGNATSMYGTQANYKLAADQAAQSDLGGVGAIMGGAARLYSSGIFGSAPAYKEHVARIGTHAGLGIGIYRYRYRPEYVGKWGAGWKIGVMADELAAVVPEAVETDADGHTVVNYSLI